MYATATENIVRRLVSFEIGSDQDGLIDASLRVADMLGSHISKMIGREGFRSLLLRAVKLTAGDYPTIVKIEILAGGSISPASVTASLKGSDVIALLCNLIDLFGTFIGSDLTLHMISVVWPHLTLDAPDGEETELP